MTTKPTIRLEAEKVSSELGQCIHCSFGWVYETDPDTGEDVTMGCWMCLEGKTIEAEPR